jgi:hypothetical protein
MYNLSCQHLERVYRTEIRLLRRYLVHYSRWVTLESNFALVSVESAVAVVVVVAVVVGIEGPLCVDEDWRRDEGTS